ncbi:MAG: plasmid stabilization protein [Planctomycetes bacterium]|nr:plasmid stabilization protein [Planctomycetota bacterium]
MANLLIPELEETLLARLQQRARIRGRSAEEEARAILADALPADSVNAWAEINAIRERLAATGHHFGDSTDLIREDRER